MTEVKEKLEHSLDQAEKIVSAVTKDEPETNKEARRRQPWMPVAGSMLTALILLAVFSAFAS